MNGGPADSRGAHGHPHQGMDYGETADVQQSHAAAVYREKVEPRIGAEPLSLWLIAIYGVAVFLGGAYFWGYAGSFAPDGLDEVGGTTQSLSKPGGGGTQVAEVAQLTPAERGKKVFSANCATCHQSTGLGSAGKYPPLAGSEFVNGGTRRLGMILLKGLQGPVKVKSAQYGSDVMQPWDKTLNDQKIADVLTYIRQEWGNSGGPVAPEGIAALRKELAGRNESWTEPDLLAVPADANLPGGAAEPPADAAKPAPGAPPAGKS